MSYRQNYLGLDPVYKDVSGLPLLRMTFDWHDNDLRMVKFMDERVTEIGLALNGSRLGGKGKDHSVPGHARCRGRCDGQRSVDQHCQ
jgi:hypothetical protein